MVNSRWSIPALDRCMQTFLLQFPITRDNCRGKLSRTLLPRGITLWTNLHFSRVRSSFHDSKTRSREVERSRERSAALNKMKWGGGRNTRALHTQRTHSVWNRIRKIQRGIYNRRTPFSCIRFHRCSFVKGGSEGIRFSISERSFAAYVSLPLFWSGNSSSLDGLKKRFL